MKQAGLAIGEHNEEIYRQYLGLSQDEYETYKASGVI